MLIYYTHQQMHHTESNSDSAGADELRLVREIAAGDYNREVEIVAETDRGVIDGAVVIGWDWLERARSIVLSPETFSQTDRSGAQPLSDAADNE